MENERIGFVGVGLMGHGMAKNILSAGYHLTVIAHRNRAPIDDLVAKGAVEAGSLADLAASSSIVHICAPGSPQVKAIVEELAPALSKGDVVVDCSTSNPTSTVALAKRLADAGIQMADAPLSGTPVQAESGALSAMVGAEDAVFERLRPVLESWASALVHLGPPGVGHKMKLLNNFLSMGYGAMYSEALALAEKVGISVAQFDSVIRGGRMDCGFYQTFMACALEGNRGAHKFTITNALKDMNYLESMADDAGIANPIGNAVKNSFSAAYSNGANGPEDYVPHLAEIVAKLNGLRG